MWALRDGREGMWSTLRRTLTSMSKWKGMGKEEPQFQLFPPSPAPHNNLFLFAFSSGGNNLLPPSLFSALQVSRGPRPHGHQEQRTCMVTIH